MNFENDSFMLLSLDLTPLSLLPLMYIFRYLAWAKFLPEKRILLLFGL
jgi:hypothetical protein